MKLALVVLTLAASAAARDWPAAVSHRAGAISGSVVGVDANGRVAQIVLSDGRIILIKHSTDGRITAERSSSGTDIAAGYDARGRLDTVTERGVIEKLVYDDANDIVGRLYGVDPSTFANAIESVGLSDHGDPHRAVITRDKGGRITSAVNDIGRTTLDYLGDSILRQTLAVGPWSFWVQRAIVGNTATLTDSAGGRYSYVMDGGLVTEIRDSAGRLLSTRTYDAMGRPLRSAVLGAVFIDYSYDAGFDWREKTVSLATGQIIGRFARRDYDDPSFDGSLHAQFRGPTGEWIASVDGDRVTYSAGVLTPFATLTTQGEVEARSFAFGSSVPYSDDEIRFMDDGSVKILPALPHAEYTLAARTVRPLTITIPPPLAATALHRPVSSTSFSIQTTSRRKLLPSPFCIH